MVLGKSTLLESLLGETNVLTGARPSLAGRSAYVPQTAWILNATVKENIVFDRPFDADWYRTCVTACCLDTDIANMKKGDDTMIGRRGSR